MNYGDEYYNINNVNRNHNRNFTNNPYYRNNYNYPFTNNNPYNNNNNNLNRAKTTRNIYNIPNNYPHFPNNYPLNYNHNYSHHNFNKFVPNNQFINRNNNINYNINNNIDDEDNIFKNEAMNLLNNNNKALIPYKNKQIKNKKSKKNQNPNIQSNDFWQKIDNRKLSHSKNLNNNFHNNLRSQNQNTNYPSHKRKNSDDMNQVFDDFFGDFFNDEVPAHHPNSNHIQIRMEDPEEDFEPHVFFNSFFTPFGIMSGAFQQNYASNFGRQLVRLIELAQRGRNPHPPATKEALKKLKRFILKERFCKKKNGKIELPNCCICQCEIEIGKETVLLPCGHMYHWDCCLQWLKTNNTCPICRFEIK